MNKIIYDYLSFTSKIHSVDNLICILGLHDIVFQQLKGFYGYKDRLYYDGISIHFNGSEEMGICVEMSGQGCRNFETVGSGDFEGIFSLILEHYNEKSEKREMNITRLDVAYDDFDGLLNLDLLVNETQKHNFCSRFNDWEVRAGNKGCSVNHGSVKSNVYIRIYDKKMERKREDLKHWVRCEIQMRGDSARGFIKLTDIIDVNYFNVLNNYIRYIVPSDNVTNNSMLSTAPYWLNFIESFETVSIFDKPGTEYNILKLDNLVFNQIGGAIDTMLKVLGPEKFLQRIKEREKPLNPKYKQIIDNMGVVKEDSIIEFLRERNAE